MPSITGRDAFLSLLEDEGVTHLFGNPGTTELAIMDALVEHPAMTYVLGLNEAIVVAMADGYARASGGLAAANVHVAPGLGNALGSLYNAMWYGAPVLLTAGQHPQGFGLTEPLLYHPLVPMAQPLVKWAVEVQRLADLPRIVRRAAKVALTPPTGPVFLSLPGDILEAQASLDLGQRTRVDARTRPADEALRRFAERALAARNPVIVSGHEVAAENALAGTARLAELLGAAVYMQTVPYSAQFPSEHPLFLGPLTRNQQQTHDRMSTHDLLICVGADVLRMSVWDELDPLPSGMPVLQIGQREHELGKNYPAEIALRADVNLTLEALNSLLEKVRSPQQEDAANTRAAAVRQHNWSAQRAELHSSLDAVAGTSPVNPDYLMRCIADEVPDDGVVVEEGLLSTRRLLHLLPLRDHQRFYGLASGGIGFAMAGAVGIQLALPQRPVTAVIGDGSALYTAQALWTAAALKLPITYVICNNRSYRILKERVIARKGATLANEKFVGMDLSDPPVDFAGLARSLGVPAQTITDPADVVPALRQARGRQGPHLLEVIVHDGFSGPPASR